MNTQADSEDTVEVALRMLSRGFVDLHLGVRAGSIVDPFALPESLGIGMQMLSRLCLVGGTPDIADSVHTLSDLARRLPLGAWGVPALSTPFRFSEVRLLSEERKGVERAGTPHAP